MTDRDDDRLYDYDDVDDDLDVIRTRMKVKASASRRGLARLGRAVWACNDDNDPHMGIGVWMGGTGRAGELLQLRDAMTSAIVVLMRTGAMRTPCSVISKVCISVILYVKGHTLLYIFS